MFTSDRPLDARAVAPNNGGIFSAGMATILSESSKYVVYQANHVVRRNLVFAPGKLQALA